MALKLNLTLILTVTLIETLTLLTVLTLQSPIKRNHKHYKFTSFQRVSPNTIADAMFQSGATEDRYMAGWLGFSST